MPDKPSVVGYPGEFEFLVLLAIARLDANAYGVTICEELERETSRTLASSPPPSPRWPGQRRARRVDRAGRRGTPGGNTLANLRARAFTSFVRRAARVDLIQTLRPE